MSAAGSADGSVASPPPSSGSPSPRRDASGSDSEGGALVGAPATAASPASVAPPEPAGDSSEADGGSGGDADGGDLANAIVAASANAAASGLLLAGQVAAVDSPRASQGAAALVDQGPGYLDAPGPDAGASGAAGSAADVTAAEAHLQVAQERLRRAHQQAGSASPVGRSFVGTPADGADGGADAARRSSRAVGPVAGGQGPPSPAAGVSTARQPLTIASFAAQQAVEAATAARKAAAADVALSRRLEEAASARAEEAHRDVVAQKRTAVAARSENAELVRAQREACERRAAELGREQRALELLEADGRHLIADANVARGQRERVYRHAAARVCERREAREEAERRVRAVRGEGHATVRMAESVLSAEGRSMRPV
ncbi:unnamed protein product, partial [Ectocarpus sp. 12 AP-2014]